MHQTLIIGIILNVAEAYESHRLPADLRHGKTRLFIHLHPSYSSIRNYHYYYLETIQRTVFHSVCLFVFNQDKHISFYSF